MEREEREVEKVWWKLNEGVRVSEGSWVASALCNTAPITQSALGLNVAVN